jgi:hypothetical protein
LAPLLLAPYAAPQANPRPHHTPSHRRSPITFSSTAPTAQSVTHPRRRHGHHSFHATAVDARSCRQSPILAPGGSVICRLSEPRTTACGMGFDDDCSSRVNPFALSATPGSLALNVATCGRPLTSPVDAVVHGFPCPCRRSCPSPPVLTASCPSALVRSPATNPSPDSMSPSR